MNVTQLSKAIGFEPENLLKQMSAAGLSHKSITDEVNNEDKKTLLTFLKSSKKTSKKTIYLKKDAPSAKKGISITRLNQNLSETKSTTKADLKGDIDFDAAEAKRKDAERKVELAKEEKQNQTVKRIKKPSTSEVKVQKKPPANTRTQFKEKQDSKKDKRELEGEKYLSLIHI